MTTTAATRTPASIQTGDLSVVAAGGAFSGPPPAPLTLRDYQIDAVKRTLSRHQLGQIIVPTGAGKTLIQATVAQQLQRVVVLVPSIQLVWQWVKDFRRQDPHRRVLGVVSQQELRGHDLQAGNTTNADDIAAFVAQDPDDVLIVATYHSSDAVVAGLAGTTVDMVMFDEAHHTAGVNAYHLAHPHAVEQPLFRRTFTGVSAKRKRFFTATQKVHSDEMQARAKAAGVNMYSMDDPKLYGPVLVHITLPQLIKDGWLSSFELLVAVTTNEQTRAALTPKVWNKLQEGDVTPQDIAACVQLLNAATDPQHPMQRILTFHNTIAKAQRIEQLLRVVAQQLGIAAVTTCHVSSASTSEERDYARSLLTTVAPGQIHIVCNVRLFSEGVDTPALDAIAYFDPKASTIDITQTIGRALRTAQGKDRAYVILPVFVDDEHNAEQVLQQSAHQTVYSVAAALYDLGITSHVAAPHYRAPDVVSEETQDQLSVPARVVLPEGMDVHEFHQGIRNILVEGRWSDVHQLRYKETVELLSRKLPQWTLTEYTSSKEVLLSCPNGHPKTTTLDQLRRKQGVRCNVCLTDEATALLADKLPQWTLVRYTGTKDVLLRCPQGHSKNTQLSKLRSARSTLRCPACLVDSGAQTVRDLLQQKLPHWTLQEYVNSKTVMISCAQGHSKTTTVDNLRKLHNDLLCRHC